MTTWDSPTIEAIAGTDDLHVAPFRADGITHGTPTWIWSVVLEGRLFVRAYNGKNSRWYRSAKAQGAGQISAAGATHKVSFTPADPALNERIDQADLGKYAGSPYLPPMLTHRTHESTVEVSPYADQQRTPWHARPSSKPNIAEEPACPSARSEVSRQWPWDSKYES